MAMFIFFVLVYWYRHFRGDRANKSESYSLLVYYFLLSFPVILGFVYFLRLQTYVIMIEVALNSMGIFFVAMQMLFSVPAIFRY